MTPPRLGLDADKGAMFRIKNEWELVLDGVLMKRPAYFITSSKQSKHSILVVCPNPESNLFQSAVRCTNICTNEVDPLS